MLELVLTITEPLLVNTVGLLSTIVPVPELSVVPVKPVVTAAPAPGVRLILLVVALSAVLLSTVQLSVPLPAVTLVVHTPAFQNSALTLAANWNSSDP